MTPAAMLRHLIAEIDRNCIVTPSDNDKILVALPRDLLDRAWQVAHTARIKEMEDENGKD